MEGKEFSASTDRLYLGLCLEVCIADAEHFSSASAQCLREALEQLDMPSTGVHRTIGVAANPPGTLVSFLRYLLPELERVAPDAALVVWQALVFLSADPLAARTTH